LREAGHPIVACRAKPGSGVGVSPEALAKKDQSGTTPLLFHSLTAMPLA
jgi:hypothetical protein